MAKQLQTVWTKEFYREHPLQEYPRPMMVRDSYVNLNGIWEYSFTTKCKCPRSFEGEIVVPYSPESHLSGVERQLQPEEYLWYRRLLPEQMITHGRNRWLLHFGAVDQRAVVFINRKKVRSHLGGYLPFTVDITEFLQEKDNELIVLVQDSSDTRWHAKGKQKLNFGGMFYPAQSGIWQTVWAEEVPDNFIEEMKITPDYDNSKVSIQLQTRENEPMEVTVFCDGRQESGKQFAHGNGMSQDVLELSMENFQEWSPESPYLYDLKITMGEDTVQGYFAMRKVSLDKDAGGISRMFLNNRPYFSNGVLDQGYWPEGLYTPPCDEAFVYDIAKMKDMGFNMLRKHIKIEPQRWYYHCDRLGMLVWQDMVNGGEGYSHWYVTYMATAMEQLGLRPKDHPRRLLSRMNAQGRREFLREMQETVQALYNHPSICVWVIFNEGWGQFNANEVTKALRKEDSTRLIDQASGWFDQGGGDFRSIHNYFFSFKVEPENRILALTEYGGYAMMVPEHVKYEKKYGYKFFDDKQALEEGYGKLFEDRIFPAMRKGLSGLVYTQLSDVEEEINGIFTYDRQVCKLSSKYLRKTNERAMEEFRKNITK